MAIVLYVDKWEWIIPLVSSYGEQVVVEEPEALRKAVIEFIARALHAYGSPTENGIMTQWTDDFDVKNDDSRLRSTHGRSP